MNTKAVIKEREAIKALGRIKDSAGVHPVILGILNKKISTPAGVTVRGRGDSKLKGKTTGRAYRCRLDGCPGYRIVVKWEDGHFTHPCSKGMLLSKQGWRIL